MFASTRQRWRKIVKNPVVIRGQEKATRRRGMGILFGRNDASKYVEKPSKRRRRRKKGVPLLRENFSENEGHDIACLTIFKPPELRSNYKVLVDATGKAGARGREEWFRRMIEGS